MARPTTGAPPPEIPFQTEDGTRVDLAIGPEGEALLELDRIVQECGPDAVWSVAVYRKTEDGLKWGYCGRLPLQGFTIDLLPPKFGGGEFLCRIMNSQNRVSKTIKANFDPQVFPRVSPGAPRLLEERGSDLSSQLVIRLSEQMEKQREQQSMFLQAVITALVGRPAPAAPSGPSLTDLVNSVAALKTLSGPDQGSIPSNVLLEAMRGALELRREAAGEEGLSDDPLYRLLEKVAPPILDALNRRAASPPVVAPKPASALTPGNPPLASPGNGGGPVPIPTELAPYTWLRKYTPTILGWAQSGFPAERAAAMIDAAVPEQYQPLLDDFIEMEPGRRHSIFVQLDARLQPYRTYLDEICRELLEEPEDVAGGEAPGAPSEA